MFYFRQFISSPGNYPFCQYIIRQSRNKVGKTAYVPTYFYFYNLIGTFFSFFSNLISFFYFSRIYFSAISPTMSFFYLLVGTFLPFFPFYKHSHRTICLFLSDYYVLLRSGRNFRTAGVVSTCRTFSHIKKACPVLFRSFPDRPFSLVIFYRCFINHTLSPGLGSFCDFSLHPLLH